MANKIKITYLYDGHPDYWQGNSRRWDDNAGCLFAYPFNGCTTHDIIAMLVEDYMTSCECDGITLTPEELEQELNNWVNFHGVLEGEFSEECIFVVLIEMEE